MGKGKSPKTRYRFCRAFGEERNGGGLDERPTAKGLGRERKKKNTRRRQGWRDLGDQREEKAKNRNVPDPYLTEEKECETQTSTRKQSL